MTPAIPLALSIGKAISSVEVPNWVPACPSFQSGERCGTEDKNARHGGKLRRGGVGCQAAGQLKPKRGDVNQSFPGANGGTGIQWQKVINLNEGRETNHKYSSINMDPLISF